jgi:hypothetical protein
MTSFWSKRECILGILDSFSFSTIHQLYRLAHVFDFFAFTLINPTSEASLWHIFL